MEALREIDWGSLRDTLVSLVAAVVCGLLIGSERQFRQRSAGLRTNTLVAISASLFVDMAERLEGRQGAVHVAAYVVSGVGFLGAGVIMREGGSVRGLNTAATLWGAAAVGACAGADLLLEALLGTCFVMGTNVLLRPVARVLIGSRLHTKPWSLCQISVTTTIDAMPRVTAALQQALSGMGLVAEALSMRPSGRGECRIAARVPSPPEGHAELQRLVQQLIELEGVHEARCDAGSGELSGEA